MKLDFLGKYLQKSVKEWVGSTHQMKRITLLKVKTVCLWYLYINIFILLLKPDIVYRSR